MADNVHLITENLSTEQLIGIDDRLFQTVYTCPDNMVKRISIIKQWYLHVRHNRLVAENLTSLDTKEKVVDQSTPS